MNVAAHPLASDTAAAPLPETVFAVPGMRCAGCIAKLERGLGELPGVIAARVNFTAKRVAIVHEASLTLPDLIAGIAALGFDADPLATSTVGDEESRALARALAVAGFAAMNIMLLSVSVWSGATGVTRDLFHWLSAIIAIPTVAYAGRPFFRSAIAALRHGRTNMDVPISIGVLLATALSLFETINRGDHAYFDGAVMLLFFLLAGRWLDSVMRDRARDGVAALLAQTAHGALVDRPGGRTEWIATAALEPGMVMRIAAGERLACDGIVVDGASRFDLSLLTGESRPAAVTTGDAVHAGTLNLDQPIAVQATARAADSAIADIARMMEDAGQGKSRYVRYADRAARWYAPAVHLLALASFAGWMIAGAGWHHSLLIAVAVLIITCPCALGLAVPVSQIVAAGALMRRGILVKDGSALERLAEADRAMFDKTGTLTLGRPQPVNLDALDDRAAGVALALARNSRHPLSMALRRALEARGVAAAPLTDAREDAGQGMRGRWNGVPVTLGRAAGPIDGDTLVTTLAMGDEAPIHLMLADHLRPDAAATVRDVQQLGLPAIILSGDRCAGVRPVAVAVGLTAQAAMTPGDKLDAIARTTAAGHRVLMVGDGLNDGPALAAGHVSIAPASASTVGQNAADLVFLGDSLAPVAIAIRAARRTQAVVRQNFALAIGYNVLAVPLAIMGHVTPLIAAAAMSASSLIVVANALRLRSAAQ